MPTTNPPTTHAKQHISGGVPPGAADTGMPSMLDHRLLSPLRRIPLFWRLQLLGWGGFGLVSFYALSVYFELAETGVLAMYESVRMTLACGLTVLLRPFYRWLRARSASIPAIAAASLAGSLAAGVGLLVTFKLTFMRWVNPLSRAGEISTYPKTILDYSQIFLAWSALYFGIKYWRDLQSERERIQRTETLARQAQLQMLRYQLNPHFLFNSLSSIHALIREDPSRAEEVVEELSDFLRSSLLSDLVTHVPLRDEIAVIRSYLKLEKIRFEDKLEVEFAIDPPSENVLLPSFLVHPLVENAVKYGMKTSPKPLRIRLSTRLSEGGLQIRVSNSGAWIPRPSPCAGTTEHCDAGQRGEARDGGAGDGEASDGEVTGIGLANVRERLRFSYPEEHHFETHEEEGWVHATITIATPGLLS